MSFLAMFLISVIITAIAYVMIPKPALPKQSSSSPSSSTFQLNTAETGRPIPIIYGRVLLKSANYIKFLDVYNRAIKKDGQTIGYAKYASFIMVLTQCYINFIALWRNGKKIGHTFRLGKPFDTYPNGLSLDLLKFPEGYWYIKNYGISTRKFYNYDFKKYENNETIKELFNNLPDYTNYSLFFAIKTYIGDGVSSISQLDFEIENFKISGWSGTHTDIDGAINPVAVIYDILINIMKLPKTLINYDSFMYATKYTQNMGISFILDESHNLKDTIDEICRHIDGIFLFNPFINKFELRVMRDDYMDNWDDLLIIDDTNSKNIQLSKTSTKELYNSITFNYTDPNTYEKNSLTYYNNALKQITVEEKNKELDYMMFRSRATIEQVADRDIKKLTNPLYKVKLQIPITYKLLPLDVFRLNIPKLDIYDMVFRVAKIGGDSIDKGYFDVEAVQDIFSVDRTSYDLVGEDKSVIDYSITGEIIAEFFEVDRQMIDCYERAYVIPFIYTLDRDDSIIDGYYAGFKTSFFHYDLNKINESLYGEIIEINDKKITVKHEPGRANEFITNKYFYSNNNLYIVNNCKKLDIGLYEYTLFVPLYEDNGLEVGKNCFIKDEIEYITTNLYENNKGLKHIKVMAYNKEVTDLTKILPFVLESKGTLPGNVYNIQYNNNIFTWDLYDPTQRTYVNDNYNSIDDPILVRTGEYDYTRYYFNIKIYDGSNVVREIKRLEGNSYSYDGNWTSIEITPVSKLFFYEGEVTVYENN